MIPTLIAKTQATIDMPMLPAKKLGYDFVVCKKLT